MKTILSTIKETRNFRSIEEIIKQKFKLVDTSSTNEVYYKNNTTTYEVTPNVYLVCGSTFEYFGSSSTGGYFVTLNMLTTTDVITLFDEDVTTTKEETTRTIKTLFDENEYTETQILELCEKSKEHNIEDFLSITKDNEKFIVPYWRGLSKEEKFDAKVLFVLLGIVYDMAMENYYEILAYNDISPYGGEDISYFPDSVGECFYDTMQNLSDYFDSYKEFERVVYNYLESRNKDDAFIEKFKKNRQHSLDIALHATKVREVLPRYFKTRMRCNYFEEMIERLNHDIDIYSSKMKQYEKEILLCQYRLSTLPMSYSLFTRIFNRKLVKANRERENELRNDMAFFLEEQELAKNGYKDAFETLVKARKETKRLSPFVSKYSKMAKDFLFDMYDEDTAYEMLTREEFNVSKEKVDRYIEHHKEKALLYVA